MAPLMGPISEASPGMWKSSRDAGPAYFTGPDDLAAHRAMVANCLCIAAASLASLAASRDSATRRS